MSNPCSEFASQEIKTTFDGFAPEFRRALITVRGWVFDIAAESDDIGSIVEELKWGQPSYATRPKSGCPIRLGVTKAGQCALFVPCQTSLISQLREHYGDMLDYDGNRAIHFSAEDIPKAELQHAIGLALRYYLRT